MEFDGVAPWPRRSAPTLTRKQVQNKQDNHGRLIRIDVERFRLSPHGRVTLSGKLQEPHTVWIARATAAGLDVGGLTTSSSLLVTNNLLMPSKATQLAQELAIPVATEDEFGQVMDRLEAELARQAAQKEQAQRATETEQAGPAAQDKPQETQQDVVAPEESENTLPEPEEAQSAEGIEIPADTDPETPADMEYEVLQPDIYQGEAGAPDEIVCADNAGTDAAENAEPAEQTVAFGKTAETEPDQSGSSEKGSDSAAAELLQYLATMSGSLDAVVHQYGPLPQYLSGTAEELEVHSTDPALEAVALLESFYAGREPREQLILSRRFVAAKEDTLADLGEQLGITREWVRQLERKVEDDLRTYASSGPIVNLLAAMRYHARPVGRLRQLVDLYPGLTKELAGWEAPLWLVLDRIDDAFIIEEGWVCFPTMEACKDQTARILDGVSNDRGVASLANVAKASHLSADELADWLKVCGHEIKAGHVICNPRSLPVRLAAALDINGEPMTVEELLDFLGEQSGKASARNALFSADDIIRVSKTKWALSEWGLEEFTSIKDFIDSRVKEPIELDDLIEEGTSKFGIAASSIRTYATSGEFQVKDSKVMRSPSAPEPASKPVDSRGMYWRDGRWMLLTTVTKDHLRGSGFGVPSGVASLLDLVFNEEKLIPSTQGDQRVKWGHTNTSVGSIRRFIEDLKVEEGERVWIDFGNGEEFAVTHAAPRASLDQATISAAQSPDEQYRLLIADLANYMGIWVEEIEQRVESLSPGTEKAYERACEELIAEALEYPAGVVRRRIVARLQHRHDDEAIRLAEALWVKSAF